MYIGRDNREKAKEKSEAERAQSESVPPENSENKENKSADTSHNDGIMSKRVKATTSVCFTEIVALNFLFYSE